MLVMTHPCSYDYCTYPVVMSYLRGLATSFHLQPVVVILSCLIPFGDAKGPPGMSWIQTYDPTVHLSATVIILK